jgi:hypothetical protein
LNGKGFDPKFDLENKHVTTEECHALFKGARKFKVKSPTLKPEDRSTLEDVYWRVFGISTIKNNEMMTWIVYGFIAQSKAKYINWAKVVESTSKEKACKDEVKVGARLAIMKKEQPWVVDSDKSLDCSKRPL